MRMIVCVCMCACVHVSQLELSWINCHVSDANICNAAWLIKIRTSLARFSYPRVEQGEMAQVVCGNGLPERFRIGSECNNYMYKSIYEAVVSCSCVNNIAHVPIVCFFQQLTVKAAENLP